MMPKIKHLVLSLTGSCNYNCEYCYASEHNQAILSYENAIRAVDMTASSSQGEPFVLQFTGGEPLLAFDLLKAIVEYVKVKGYRAILQVQTNGSLLTKEIALYLKANKVAIGVSLDGIPSVNDILRKTKAGDGAARETVTGIQLLAHLNIAIGITCVVTAANVEHLTGLVEFAYYLGNVRRIGFDLLRGQGRGNRLQPAGDKEVAEAIVALDKRAQQLSELAGYKILFTQKQAVEGLLWADTENCKIGCTKHSEGFSHCYAMRGEAAFVDAKGDIYACSSFVGNPEYYLGNVLTGMESKRVNSVGMRMKKEMEFCFSCPSFKYCGGGCYARWQSRKAVEECALKQAYISLLITK